MPATEFAGEKAGVSAQLINEREPTWYKDAIIYQLHVKSFYDSNNDGIGDFPGLIEKLDYIAALGVNTIWLLPFYPSPLRDDGYDIADYYGVNPDYGTIEDVKQFIAAAHARGLRVITELVINHTSDQHPWFKAARAAPPGSPEREFYVWSDDDTRYSGTRIIFLDTEKSNWTWDSEAKAYFWHRFYSHQPDLNFDNPAVLKAVLDVMNYWLALGVDGLRLDAVPYLVEREGTNNENLPETHAVLKAIRAEVDAKFPGRLLLAEANQWPEDTQEYFGDGDECHMAFHFPLMPRMYMALAQEDRFPITDILRQTPAIPETCQWAIFLRNHDELTLEMVTDRERDYLWNQYASENRARLNLGIRRRLAPLMQRDRRRIELLNSLLFSMPGTPTLYYGDEICMGDNIYLGDRDGVRTPMQWTPDRNGGFSKADPSRLILPPIMDPLYGYESVNVEAQSRDPFSLLNWTRLHLEVRRRYRAFGRGSFKMLFPTNRRILAYLREFTPPDGGASETILCVANMARTAQAVELDLSAYAGYVPLEMTGGSSFPPIGELNYLLTMPAYGFNWFLLTQDNQLPAWYVRPPEPMPDLLTLVLRSDVANVVEPPLLSTLERDILPPYLSVRRWFGAKNATVGSIHLQYGEQLPRLADVEYADIYLAQLAVEVDGKLQQYQIPLTVYLEDHQVPALAHQLALARVRRKQRVGVLTDAVSSEYFARSIIAGLQNAAAGEAVGRELVFVPTKALPGAELDAPDLEVRALSVEQSNSSMIIAERAVLKLLRRVSSGPHPEVDMSGALTEGDYANTAPLLGYVMRRRPDGERTVLAVLQGYIPNQGNAWEWLLDQLSRLNHETTTLETAQVTEGELKADIEAHAGVALDELVQFAAVIGKRLGEMHQVLSRPQSQEAFSPRPATEADCLHWASQVRRQLAAALEQLAAERNSLAGHQLQASCERLLAVREALLALPDKLARQGIGSLLMRIHGDLHLGQILVSQDDAYFIDFEGEPMKSLEERTAKTSPYRDVAGMLRSFHYATETAAQPTNVLETERAHALHLEFLEEFHSAAPRAFLAAYLASAQLPQQLSEAGQQALIQLFTLEKAAYEILYEAANRPTWLATPVKGLLESAKQAGLQV